MTMSLEYDQSFMTEPVVIVIGIDKTTKQIFVIVCIIFRSTHIIIIVIFEYSL